MKLYGREYIHMEVSQFMGIIKGVYQESATLCKLFCSHPRNDWSIRYYAKRFFVKDPRLALLPSDFFSAAVVLDIGCNEGWVTCEIGQNSDNNVSLSAKINFCSATMGSKESCWR